MRLVNDFKDYEILDLSGGMKLERWGNIVLSRPDPQVIWDEKNSNLWSKADAKYNRSKTGGGFWETINPKMPSEFIVKYQDLSFKLKLMGFKHTGLFPEQAVNWNLIRSLIKKANREVKVLNLFAYTGAASIAALKSGASVVHVDSSRGMVDWAKENVKLNHLEDKNIRFIVDDCLKFVKREIRRGNKYDIILMDIMMPKMNGDETLKNLKKDKNFNTPVIAVTADVETGAEKKYLKQGFISYISKPYTKEEIEDKLDLFIIDK